MAFRMIFMGSDPIALPALESIVGGRCGEIDLLAVYTQPDRPRGRGKKVAPNEIKTWANERGIPTLQPEKMTKAVRLEIAEMQPDSILVMAYGHLLSQALIDTPRFGIWNLHTSLLPKYRGASPIQCAVAEGDEATGVSLMRMVREMDAGPVLDVQKVSIEKLDTALDVEGKLSAACAPLIERNLPQIHAGEAQAREQDASLASFVRKLEKEDGELDFAAEASVLARRINGLFPWPGARAQLGEQVIKFGLADSDASTVDAVPGAVLGVERDGLRVACGSGTLALKRLQRPGGKMLDAAEFARGFELTSDACFESRPMTELVKDSPLRG